MTEYKQKLTTEIVDSDPIEDFVREYNSRMDYKDKKILELQNRIRELEDELRRHSIDV